MIDEKDLFTEEDKKITKQTVYADFNTTKAAIFEYFEGYHQTFREMLNYTELNIEIPSDVYVGLISYAKGLYFLTKNYYSKIKKGTPLYNNSIKVKNILSKHTANRQYSIDDFYFFEDFFTSFVVEFGIFNLNVNKGSDFLWIE